MKNIFKSLKISLIAVVLLFTSCEEHLNVATYNNITGSTFWQNPSDAAAATIALNASFMSIMRGSNNQISNVDGRTDLWKSGTLGPRLTGPVEGHFQTSNSGTGGWRSYYQIIHDANLLFANIDNIDFPEESEKNNYLAIASTIRAMTYFELVRIFGAVPLVTEPTTEKPNPEDYPGRTAKTEILDYIKADIETAIPLFASEFGDNNFVNKLSALALKADVYMWTAKALTPRGSSISADLNTAISAIQAIEDSGELTFASNYADIYTRSANSSPEFILANYYENGLESSNYAHASIRDNAVPDQYKVFDNEGNVTRKLFPYAVENEGLTRMSYGDNLDVIYNKYQTVDIHDDPFNQWDDDDVDGSLLVPPTQQVLRYDRRDLRYINNVINIAGSDDQVVIKYPGIEDLGAARRWYDNDLPLYTLTSMLLLKAEAYNTLGQPENAIAIMDMTRARAGLAAYPGARDQATIEDELLDEAARELFGENRRWWHLIREHKVAENVPRFMTERGNDETDASVWNFYYWPIAESLLIANGNLEQSPGYGTN